MSVVRRDGREPMGLGAAIGGLVTERAWDVLTAGGTVLDRWPDIAAGLSPELPDHVQAVTFHSETGQLDLLPALPAYATQLRLIAPRIVAASNEPAGTDVVRTVRVLPVGASPAPRVMEPAPTAAPEAPVKTREMASPSFHQALAAHCQAAPPSLADPDIAQAVERQTRAMRELSARVFPEPDEASASIEAARAQRRRDAGKTRIAALRQARKDRAARQSGTAAAAARKPVQLRTTA